MKEKEHSSALQHIKTNGKGGLFITDTMKALQHSFANNEAVFVVTGHEVDQVSALRASLTASMDVYASKRFFVFPYAIGKDHNIGVVVDREKGKIRVYDHQNGTRRVSLQDKALQQIAAELGYVIEDGCNQSPYTAQKHDWECGILAVLSIEKDVERFQHHKGFPPKGEKETPNFDAELERIWRISQEEEATPESTSPWQELWQESFPTEDPASWVKEKLEGLSPAAYEPRNREALVHWIKILRFESTFADKNRIDLLGIIDNAGAETLEELQQYLNANSAFIKRYLPAGREESQLHWLQGIASAYWFEKEHATHKEVIPQEVMDREKGQYEAFQKAKEALLQKQVEQFKQAAPWLFEKAKHLPEETLSAMYNIPLREMQSHGITEQVLRQLDFTAIRLQDGETQKIVADVCNAAGKVRQLLLDVVEKRDWGSFASLLANHPFILVEYIGHALEKVASTERPDIVELLLEKWPNIPEKAVGNALVNAASSGQHDTVTRLLERPDIPAEAVGRALEEAASNGHLGIVTKLLERRIDIRTEAVEEAFKEAVVMGYKNIVELLLERRIDIRTEAVEEAFKKAVVMGHKNIVELLLERRNDIRTKALEEALDIAVMGHKGHKEYIVELLLERRNDIRTEVVEEAFKKAVVMGHKNIVELLLERRKDIRTEAVEEAFNKAVVMGHKGIVALLLEKRPDIPVKHIWQVLFGRQHRPELWETLIAMLPKELAGAALEEAVRNGNTAIIFQLLERPNIPAEAVGKTLQWAAEEGLAGIVTKLLERPNIPADDVGFALILAIKQGNRYSAIKLIGYSQPIAPDALGAALVGAVQDRENPLLLVSQLIFRRGNSIPAKDIEKALEEAVRLKDDNMVTTLLGLWHSVDDPTVGEALLGMFQRQVTPSIGTKMIEGKIQKIDVAYVDKILVEAAKNGDKEVVSTIIQQRPDIDRIKVGEALIEAVKEGNQYTVPIVKLLLERKNKAISGEHAGEALVEAVKKGYKNTVVELLLKKKGKTISGEHAGEALVEAAGKGYKDTVKLLLKKKGKAISDEYAWEALVEAVNGGKEDIAKRLVRKVKFKNLKGTGADLVKAVRKGNMDVARKLLTAGEEKWSSNSQYSEKAPDSEKASEEGSRGPIKEKEKGKEKEDAGKERIPDQHSQGDNEGQATFPPSQWVQSLPPYLLPDHPRPPLEIAGYVASLRVMEESRPSHRRHPSSRPARSPHDPKPVGIGPAAVREWIESVHRREFTGSGGDVGRSGHGL